MDEKQAERTNELKRQGEMLMAGQCPHGHGSVERFGRQSRRCVTKGCIWMVLETKNEREAGN